MKDFSSLLCFSILKQFFTSKKLRCWFFISFTRLKVYMIYKYEITIQIAILRSCWMCREKPYPRNYKNILIKKDKIITIFKKSLSFYFILQFFIEKCYKIWIKKLLKKHFYPKIIMKMIKRFCIFIFDDTSTYFLW